MVPAMIASVLHGISAIAAWSQRRLSIRREFLATLEGAARSSRTRLIGGRGAFSLAELAGDLLEDSGVVMLASSLSAEFAIAANLVALHRLISGFPRVGRHLVRGPAGASFAVEKGGHSVVFGSPGSAIVAAHGSLSATPRTTYATSPVS
jgi:hypothetical protein